MKRAFWTVLIVAVVTACLGTQTFAQDQEETAPGGRRARMKQWLDKNDDGQVGPRERYQDLQLPDIAAFRTLSALRLRAILAAMAHLLAPPDAMREANSRFQICGSRGPRCL